jgi:hypothetical protein
MLRHIGAALGLLLLSLVGCVNPQMRAKMAEETEKERDLDIRTVGEVSVIGNVAPMQIHGVGLVTGLDGTGHCPPGFYRNILEQYLLKHSGPRGGEIVHDQQKTKIRQVLDSPNNCLVIVTGHLPPGVRKSDRFDVDVKLPEGSKATSLAGGTLLVCDLRVWKSEAELSERLQNSNQLHSGHVYATAKGQLIVGFGNNQDASELKQGRIWQGGISRIDRPYAFMMNRDEKSLRIANSVAERLNFMYQDDPHSKAVLSDQQKQILLMGDAARQLNQRHDPIGATQTEMAKAVSKEVINVRVPFAYRFDHERFLRVSRLTPLSDKDTDLPRYRKRLEKMLLDPRDTMRAAIRLEAMGRDSIPSLKTALENEHPFVRFASAEALAYLGNTAGVDALAQLAREHPILASHCTIALANLGETICRHKLADLLVTDEPALRCAAFHALSLLDDTDPRLGGININDSFLLYRQPMAPNAMVYYSTGKRAQIVCYGRNITLSPKTRMMVGKDFIVTMNEGESQCMVKRITSQGEAKKSCTPRLDEVLTTLSDLGAAYPDLVDFLRRAKEYEYVNCPVVNWTIPQVTLEQLVEQGRDLAPPAASAIRQASMRE